MDDPRPLPGIFGEEAQAWAASQPLLATLLMAVALGILAWLSYVVAKRLLVLFLRRLGKGKASDLGPSLKGRRVGYHVALLLPLIVVRAGLRYLPALGPGALLGLSRLIDVALVVVTARAVIAVIRGLGDRYARTPRGADQPVARYLQVASLVIYVLASFVSLGVLLDRDPLVILTGVGAASAVLLLVFQNTILSFVAGGQLTSNDYLRLGDWIEMPEMNADGNVIEIGLNTVTVQNWDKTLTIIPAHNFLGKSFKNWRGMQASGGRRIKRSLELDTASIRFLDDDDIERLSAFALLRPYFEEKRAELAAWERDHPEAAAERVNARRLTNVGTFRAYVLRYLQAHPRIATEMMLMVRQLQAGPNGLPLELYAFVSDVRAVVYEAVQSDIFDHMIAILPEFDLRLFQAPSGNDVRALSQALAESRPAGESATT